MRMTAPLALCLALGACMVGPDYRQPAMALPQGFKEGGQWQRAVANPQGALDSRWWLAFGDPQLTALVEQAARANQSIVAAQAAYRQAQAQVALSRAGLWPTVSVGLSGSRGEGGSGASQASGSSTGVQQTVSASLGASWEPDLWGQVRRSIESSEALAQVSDAQLAGVRLSIAASVASNYLGLRQFDLDIDLLQQQQRLNQQLLDMTQASFLQGTASNDQILLAQDQLSNVVAALQTSQRNREQFEHALAVLVGQAPAQFSVAPRTDYAFAVPHPPLNLPSQLLLRRPDVIAAERTAASANARIGVAEAAFYPTLDLTADVGFRGSSLGGLFNVANRVWSLGPALSATLFDGGAREATLKQAYAGYDQDVASYRGTVLAALQNVEDNLSAFNHLQRQAETYQQIHRRNQQLFASQQAQQRAGVSSLQTVVTQQLLLLQSEQNLRDAQGQLSQASVGLIQSLGGGWQAPGPGH
jgi:NodT family efflux transporter outer membrane factor (OMF) lipoprotein